MPGIGKVAVVSTAAALANCAVLGPLSWLQVVVTAPGGFGRPSSVTVASSVADAGSTTFRSGPAFTTGGTLPGVMPGAAESSNILPSTALGSSLLSTARSTT